jgi:minor histocompatibility antigen H13
MSYDAELLAAYASLTAQALVPIALGSFKSLKVGSGRLLFLNIGAFTVTSMSHPHPLSRSSVDGCENTPLMPQTPQSTIAKRKRSHPETLLSEDTEDEEEGIEETLTWADSLLFPVLGSVALVGLFLVIKYFGSEWLNLFLGVYCESSRTS